MEKVATIHDRVNVSNLDPVYTFYDQKASRGEIGENSARLRCTALRQLTTILGEDEPASPAWVLENLPDIARRYATRKMANPDTVAAYESRARGALQDYLAWQQSPTTFRFKVRERSADAAPRKKHARAADSSPAAQSPVQAPAESQPEATQVPPTGAHEPEAARTPQVASSTLVRSFPLGNGREFKFELPDGLSYRDVLKVSLHLVTMAEDFDPFGNEEHKQLFSLVRHAR